MKNWTKWYKKTLDKARNENKKENDKTEGLSEREKATWEFLMKQYGLTEKAVSTAQKEMNKIKQESDVKQRENQVKKALAKDQVSENVTRKGKNNVDAESIENQNIERAYKAKEENLKSKQTEKEDNVKANLDSRLTEINDYTKNQVKRLDENYDKISEDAYKIVKNRIDYLLKYNDTGKGDMFFDIKKDLLKIIEDNKEQLSEERYKELNDFVNSKIYIDKDSLKHNVTLHVDDEEITMTAREFEWTSKIEFKPFSDVGLVYGELINVIYNGSAYKVKLGVVASNYETNVANVIVKRKKITLKVGQCIQYNGKVYAYAGEGVWRIVIERGKANDKDGLQALMIAYNDDLYGDVTKEEEN